MQKLFTTPKSRKTFALGKWLFLYILFFFFGLTHEHCLALPGGFNDLAEGEREFYGSEKEEKFRRRGIIWEVEDWQDHYANRVLLFAKYTNYPKYRSLGIFPFYYHIFSKIDNRSHIRILALEHSQRKNTTSYRLYPLIFFQSHVKNIDYSLLAAPFFYHSHIKTDLERESRFYSLLYAQVNSYQFDENATAKLWSPKNNPNTQFDHNNLTGHTKMNLSPLHFFRLETQSESKDLLLMVPIIPLFYLSKYENENNPTQIYHHILPLYNYDHSYETQSWRFLLVAYIEKDKLDNPNNPWQKAYLFPFLFYRRDSSLLLLPFYKGYRGRTTFSHLTPFFYFEYYYQHSVNSDNYKSKPESTEKSTEEAAQKISVNSVNKEEKLAKLFIFPFFYYIPSTNSSSLMLFPFYGHYLSENAKHYYGPFFYFSRKDIIKHNYVLLFYQYQNTYSGERSTFMAPVYGQWKYINSNGLVIFPFYHHIWQKQKSHCFGPFYYFYRGSQSRFDYFFNTISIKWQQQTQSRSAFSVFPAYYQWHLGQNWGDLLLPVYANYANTRGYRLHANASGFASTQRPGIVTLKVGADDKVYEKESWFIIDISISWFYNIFSFERRQRLFQIDSFYQADMLGKILTDNQVNNHDKSNKEKTNASNLGDDSEKDLENQEINDRKNKKDIKEKKDKEEIKDKEDNKDRKDRKEEKKSATKSENLTAEEELEQNDKESLDKKNKNRENKNQDKSFENKSLQSYRSFQNKALLKQYQLDTIAEEDLPQKDIFIDRSRQLTKENSLRYTGYGLLFGWARYEQTDFYSHFRLLPLSWLTWRSQAKDKLLLFFPLFLWYNQQHLEYFVVMPFYGHQKDDKSLIQSYLLFAYLSERYKENNHRENSILWPILNYYHNDRGSGFRIFPFYWRKKTILSEESQNIFHFSWLFISDLKRSNTGQIQSHRFGLLPILLYYHYKKYEDNSTAKIISPFYWYHYSISSDDLSTQHINPFFYWRQTKRSLNQGKSLAIWPLLFYNHSKQGPCQQDSIWYLMVVYYRQNNLLDNCFASSKTDKNSDSHLRNDTTIITPFYMHWMMSRQTTHRNYDYYGTTFIPALYYHSVDSNNSRHTNILLFYDHNIDHGSPTRLVVFPYWGQYNKNINYHHIAPFYFSSWRNNHLRWLFLVGLYYEKFNRDNWQNIDYNVNFLFLADFYRISDTENDNDNDKSESEYSINEWEIYFALHLVDIKKGNQYIHFEALTDWFLTYHHDPEYFNISALWLGFQTNSNQSTFDLNLIPFYYQSSYSSELAEDIKTSEKQLLLVIPPALTYISHQPLQRKQIIALGLLFYGNDNIENKQSLKHWLMGIVYFDRRLPERQYHSQGSLWGFLWNYQREEETGFEKFSILRWFSRTTIKNKTYYRILGIRL